MSSVHEGRMIIRLRVLNVARSFEHTNSGNRSEDPLYVGSFVGVFRLLGPTHLQRGVREEPLCFLSR